MSEIAGIQQAVWLRAEGGCAVVLVEVDGEWVEIIREMLDSPFSHIKEPSADLVPAPPSQAQPDVTEAMVEAMVEAENVLVSLSENVAKHGNYTPESTVLFVGQALSAVRAALSAREGGGK